MNISFSKTLSSSSTTTPLFHLPNLSGLSTQTPPPKSSTIIHMKVGSKIYPGGVSKWKWRRMQAIKSEKLLKDGLRRERQIYITRKRAELNAAAAELERPWEVPRLFEDVEGLPSSR